MLPCVYADFINEYEYMKFSRLHKHSFICLFYTIFSLGRFGKITFVQYFRTIMVCKISSQKSSANYLAPRVFSQKSFVDSIFGHFFCPFSEIFSTLVQSFSTKITKLIYVVNA